MDIRTQHGQKYVDIQMTSLFLIAEHVISDPTTSLSVCWDLLSFSHHSHLGNKVWLTVSVPVYPKAVPNGQG